MEQHYKLHRVRELADNDQDFIETLAAAFVEEMTPDLERLKQAVISLNYSETYQAAHKMKPTVDLFELGVLDKLIEVQDWGKFTKEGEDISNQLQMVVTSVENALAEIKQDFNV